MGIDYHVLSLGSIAESFDLGGGAWGGCQGRGGKASLNYNEIPLDLTSYHDDQEAFAQHVRDVWNSGYVEAEDDNGEYMLGVGRQLWQWCTDHGWAVRLWSDHDNDDIDILEYQETGSRFSTDGLVEESGVL